MNKGKSRGFGEIFVAIVMYCTRFKADRDQPWCRRFDNKVWSVALLFVYFLIAGWSCQETVSPESEPTYSTLTGTVLNTDFYFPVQDAEVTLLRQDRTSLTDSAGVFFLDSLETGIDTIRVSAAYYDTLYVIEDIIDSVETMDFSLTVDEDMGCLPVEDTNRVYYAPYRSTPLEISTEAIYARFYPEVNDTNQILEVLDEHNLQVYRGFGFRKGQYVATLCITDGRRPECHFTPYGKEGWDNFGSNPLVEYSFLLFDGTYHVHGYVTFVISPGTPQERVDSLFSANGLRLIDAQERFYGTFYRTSITPKAKKNVLDLALELQASVPFAEYVNATRDQGSLPGGPAELQCR